MHHLSQPPGRELDINVCRLTHICIIQGTWAPETWSVTPQRSPSPTLVGYSSWLHWTMKMVSISKIGRGGCVQ